MAVTALEFETDVAATESPTPDPENGLICNGKSTLINLKNSIYLTNYFNTTNKME